MRKIVVGIVAVGLLLGVSAIGQQQGNLTSAYYVQIKPGMSASAETALKAHAEWRAENGDPWSWRVYTIERGQNLGDLIIRSSGHTWADFDSYEPFLRKGAVHFNAVMGPVMQSITSSIDMSVAELSHWPDGTASDLVSVTSFSLHPSHAMKVRQSIAAIHKTIRDANWGRAYAWSTTVSGGSGNTMTVAVPFANWAAMQPPDKEMMQVMVEAHGEEKAASVMRDFTDGILDSSNFVVRYRPDLSVNAN